MNQRPWPLCPPGIGAGAPRRPFHLPQRMKPLPPLFLSYENASDLNLIKLAGAPRRAAHLTGNDFFFFFHCLIQSAQCLRSDLSVNEDW